MNRAPDDLLGSTWTLDGRWCRVVALHTLGRVRLRFANGERRELWGTAFRAWVRDGRLEAA